MSSSMLHEMARPRRRKYHMFRQWRCLDTDSRPQAGQTGRYISGVGVLWQLVIVSNLPGAQPEDDA